MPSARDLLSQLDPDLLEALADMVAKRLPNPSIGLLTIQTLTRSADGTTKVSGVELETEQDREQLEKIIQGVAAPPVGTKVLKAAVDLEAQVSVFLGERKRTPDGRQDSQAPL